MGRNSIETLGMPYLLPMGPRIHSDPDLASPTRWLARRAIERIHKDDRLQMRCPTWLARRASERILSLARRANEF